MSKRWISVQKITSNLQLHRNKTTDNIIDKKTLRYISLNFKVKSRKLWKFISLTFTLNVLMTSSEMFSNFAELNKTLKIDQW